MTSSSPISSNSRRDLPSAPDPEVNQRIEFALAYGVGKRNNFRFSV